MTVAFFTLTSVFSSLAILALISVESVFHDELAAVEFVSNSRFSHKFKLFANLKFWGVKIFVSVEFCLQLIVMAVDMDKIHKQLLYTLCMAVLCFLVSVVHIWAYYPKGRWITLGGNEHSETASVASGLSMQHIAHGTPFLHATESLSSSSCRPFAEESWRKHQPDMAVDETSTTADDHQQRWEPPIYQQSVASTDIPETMDAQSLPETSAALDGETPRISEICDDPAEVGDKS